MDDKRINPKDSAETVSTFEKDDGVIEELVVGILQ